MIPRIGIQQPADHRGQVEVRILLLAQGVERRHLDVNVPVARQITQLLHVRIADLAICAYPPQVVDHHRRVRMAGAHPVNRRERVRIHQLPGGGPASRPNIMWITEVCLYNAGTLN